MTHVLCSISTCNRYRTTLPLALTSVVNQTRVPDQLIVFDDSDPAEDLRSDPLYNSLFKMMDSKGISWEWIWAGKKGQHHNHQSANRRAREWVWRVDDDNIAEPNVLETLLKYVSPSVGAVATSCLTPHWDQTTRSATGLITRIDQEPNLQWGRIQQAQRVEHLHCSFLYRARVADYNLALSRVAHREETLFSWQLHQKGYQLWVVPDAVTWHLKSDTGGIRSEHQTELYARDNQLFENYLKYKDQTVVVLDSGMGDHVVFSKVLPKLKDPVVFSCYPDLVPGHSIAEAYNLFGDLGQWNIYQKMDQWQWKGSLQSAFEKLYGVAQ